MSIQSVDSLIKWVSILYRRHSYYGAIFLSWEKYKYSLDDPYESHPGYIETDINAIDLIPDGISTSVTTDIYIYTNDD